MYPFLLLILRKYLNKIFPIELWCFKFTVISVKVVEVDIHMCAKFHGNTLSRSGDTKIPQK